jgi:hypothetical protein
VRNTHSLHRMNIACLRGCPAPSSLPHLSVQSQHYKKTMARVPNRSLPALRTADEAASVEPPGPPSLRYPDQQHSAKDSRFHLRNWTRTRSIRKAEARLHHHGNLRPLLLSSSARWGASWPLIAAPSLHTDLLRTSHRLFVRQRIDRVLPRRLERRIERSKQRTAKSNGNRIDDPYYGDLEAHRRETGM